MSLVELKFRKDGPVLTQAFGKIKTIQDTRIFFSSFGERLFFDWKCACEKSDLKIDAWGNHFFTYARIDLRPKKGKVAAKRKNCVHFY